MDTANFDILVYFYKDGLEKPASDTLKIKQPLDCITRESINK